jgi:hypothetical protein
MTEADTSEPEITLEQSRISKTLTERTMQAIVLIILSLLFLLPLFSPDTYDGDNHANSDMFDITVDLYEGKSWEAYVGSVNLIVENTRNDTQYPIISMEVPDIFGIPFNTNLQRYYPNKSLGLLTDLNQYRYDEYS